MDLRIMFSIFLLLASFIAGILGIVPAWQAIDESIVAKRNIEKTVRDLGEYFQNFDQLKKDIKDNVTLEKCNRLNNIAPAGLDLPQLLLQFDGLASAHRSQMLSLSADEPVSVSEDVTALKRSKINAGMPIAMDDVMTFLDDVYHLERLIDITSVKIVIADDTQNTGQGSLNLIEGYVYSSIRPLDCQNIAK